MLKRVSIGLIVLAVVAMPMVAMAAPEAAPTNESAGKITVQAPSSMLFDSRGAAVFGAAIGAGLVIIGGAKGIGMIGGNAVEAMARQPEAAGSISTAMIITAAMIEGATLFAVAVCLLCMILVKT